MAMTGKEMWHLYCEKEKLDPSIPCDIWKFCGGGPAADELAELVLEGKKTATAGAMIAYEIEKEPIPEAGCYSVVLFDDERAACVIRDTKVSLVPFDQVSPEHAWKEGEGDRSLAYWRSVHKSFFTPDYEQAGQLFDEHGLCVLEEFEVVFAE